MESIDSLFPNRVQGGNIVVILRVLSDASTMLTVIPKTEFKNPNFAIYLISSVVSH